MQIGETEFETNLTHTLAVGITQKLTPTVFRVSVEWDKDNWVTRFYSYITLS